jgi:hypothetical protein
MVTGGRLHWIWVFYIIMGTGLALSFAFVGKFNPKNKSQPPLDQVRLLQPEADCRPLEKPCAALGLDVALVAQLYPQDQGYHLVVKSLGISGQGQLAWLDDQGQPLGKSQGLVEAGKRHWTLHLTRPQRAKSLRISFWHNEEWLVADLPIR